MFRTRVSPDTFKADAQEPKAQDIGDDLAGFERSSQNTELFDGGATEGEPSDEQGKPQLPEARLQWSPE